MVSILIIYHSIAETNFEMSNFVVYILPSMMYLFNLSNNVIWLVLADNVDKFKLLCLIKYLNWNFFTYNIVNFRIYNYYYSVLF